MTKKSRGGSYPIDWPDIAKKVKDAASWSCVRCKQPHNPEAGYALTVHHLDMNPGNCAWWNLLALCQRCHLQIQNKVVIEQPYFFEHTEWFRPYVAGYYASVNGLATDKDFVLSNLDDLLRLGIGGIEK